MIHASFNTKQPPRTNNIRAMIHANQLLKILFFKISNFQLPEVGLEEASLDPDVCSSVRSSPSVRPVRRRVTLVQVDFASPKLSRSRGTVRKKSGLLEE